MIEGIFGRDFTVIERALDVRMARQQMLSANVANVDTPGYRHLDVNFRESLQQLMVHEDTVAAAKGIFAERSRADVEEISLPPQLRVQGVDGLMVGPDSNSANLELLMGRVTENNLQYRIAAEIMAGKFRKLSTVLDGVSR